MRKALLLSGLAALVAIMAGCGGGGGGGTRLNSSSKIVVGYVYVSTNNVPAGSPDIVVTQSATAPDGYAAPTAGILNLHVDNGTITRSADEPFDMATDGNAIVARVTSLSSSTPTLEFSGSGFQLNGVPKSNIPTQSLPMTGANDITLVLTYQSPAYTPGAPAAIKVMVLDPNGADRFGAPGDVIPNIIPSTNPADAYQIAVIALDANNVVIPGTTPTITDPNSNATENAVAEGGGLITVSGGGVEGTPVAITAGVTAAPGITTTFTTNYTYGPVGAFIATFSPAGPVTLTWPGVAGPGASQAYTATVTNGHGVPVPTLGVSFTRADTGTSGTGAAALDPYPAPATGNAISGAAPTTNASGQAAVTFFTPDGAAGNAAFNSLSIKGTDKLQIRAGSTSGTVMGFTSVVINRPLASLTIQGATRLDVGTQSKAFPLSNSYAVTGALDIDTLAVPAPSGVYTWTITPAGNGGTIFIGDPDNLTLRGVASPSIVGSPTGASIVIAGGPNAGQFTVTATLGVTSNVVTTNVFGPPSKVILSPTPTATGYHGSAGAAQQITASYQDAWGHDVTLESTTTTKGGSVNSNGASITFPALPSLVYNAVLPNANGTATATLTLSGNWTGTGQGTAVGSGAFNLSRAVDLVVP